MSTDRKGTLPCMRRVTGRTDRVVVVGAGLGGLACALHLAGAGREVTVLEREAVPGGRAGRLTVDGYDFDTGPTVLTMPDLVAEALAAVGERLPDWLELTPLEPAYRAHFPDGSTLDVIADTARMAGEIGRVCGPREADGYLRFVDYARRLWRLERADFIERNLDSPTDLLNANLVRLLLMGGFRRLQTKVDRFFADPRTRRIFSFQAMYAGLAPVRRSPSTRSSPTSTRWPVCFSRTAASTPYRARSPGPPKSTVSGSVTAQRLPAWRRPLAGRSPYTPRAGNGSPPTPSCSIPTCRSPTNSWDPRRQGCAIRRPASCCTWALPRGTQRSRTIISTSDGRGGLLSTR
ncbi:hypothetical protein Prum_040110 [Phytohabitans rumicis]|uniref:Amine oxidase domain-containing protein n=1 Tax=Phytohabitans rumicis TaxID=1076125 RepID=A0A6V8L6U9_9ACTN|nr:hypothetical protein Prum_040110 [Phytohabitans rumicis]